MPQYTIWHNPRCSKSRQTLALLQERGVAVVERRYLEDIPTRSEIEAVLAALNIKPGDLVRRGEAQFKSLAMGRNASDEDLLKAMVQHPVLIERPVVLRDDDTAVLGRPPENVLLLLDD